MTLRTGVLVLGLAGPLLVQGSASAETIPKGQLLITHTSADLESTVLLIEGQNFGSNPTVLFGAAGG